MADENLDVVLSEGDIVAVDNRLTIEEPQIDKADVVLADPVADVAEVDVTLEPVVEVVAEVDVTPASVVEIPPGPPSDIEVQAALETIAPGAYFRNRCNLGPATDTFVVGGPFAPGRQRWVQTPTNDSAQKQAEAIRDALL